MTGWGSLEEEEAGFVKAHVEAKGRELAGYLGNGGLGKEGGFGELVRESQEGVERANA